MFSFRKALFKMIDFDTLRVRHAGTVVLASGFCSFLLVSIWCIPYHSVFRT